MPTRKRNEYLDAESSDDNKSGYDSGAVEDVTSSRTIQHGRKRQKVSLSAFSSGDENEDSPSESPPSKPLTIAARTSQPPATSKSKDPASASSPQQKQPRKSAPSKLLPATTTTSPTLAHKPGVIYLSRIPPFMRPATLRRLLSPYGTITRLFLTPEAHSTYLARRAQGGNKKHSFTDGWVEFARRRHAKACADAINATTMGGRGWYADDVWNARYLRGFTWADLMGGVRAEEREREDRIRLGLQREGRERKEFLRAVESGRVQARRKAKNKIPKQTEPEGRRDEVDAGAPDAPAAPAADGIDTKRKPAFERRFRQNVPRIRDSDSAHAEQSEDAKRVLSKIF